MHDLQSLGPGLRPLADVVQVPVFGVNANEDILFQKFIEVEGLVVASLNSFVGGEGLGEFFLLLQYTQNQIFKFEILEI